MKTQLNRYAKIIESIFRAKFVVGCREIPFQRKEIEQAAKALRIKLPKNLGDVLYSFRFRTPLPLSIETKAPDGQRWIIELAGHGYYRFRLRDIAQCEIKPNATLAETKVPDATPGVVDLYALSDEQALLAKLRYNRLIDIFTGVTCYSLQNHLQTTVSGMGQIETDEIYVGVDRRGVHYVIPIQAKGGRDRLGSVQIEQDMAMCQGKFPDLICRPVGAVGMAGGLIALFEFERSEDGVAVSAEKHYRLVPSEEFSPSDLEAYRKRVAE